MSKYIPPHLRKKQQEGGGVPGPGPAPSSSSSTSNSTRSGTSLAAARSNGRRSNFNSHPKQQQHRHEQQTTTTTTTTTPSRWANVDRSLIQKQQQSSKIIFFGDSFVRLFGLMKHPDLQVVAFKGASAKGLGRDANDNRSTILRQVQQQKPQRVVLCFGSVDVHLSYYYTKYTREGGEIIDLPAVARSLVEFAALLQHHVPVVHIVGVYPSPLQPQNVQESLVAYGAIGPETFLEEKDISIDGRQQRARAFNQVLQEACAEYNENGSVLIFDTAFDDVLDPSTELLKPSFQDVSSYNIHIVWETTLLLWMERWEWFRALAKPGFRAGLQRTLDEYLKTKPWAEQTHVAASVGVEGAFDRDKTET